MRFPLIIMSSKPITILIVLVLLVLNVVYGRVIPRNGDRTRTEAMEYLQKYGYLRGSDVLAAYSSGSSSDGRVTSAIRHFQRMAGLPQTGVTDAATMQMMRAPRCGVADIMSDDESARRVKRFALAGSKWNVTTLSYKINSYTPDLGYPEQREIFAEAFRMWSSVIPLEFRRHRYQRAADISIRFERGDHGDGYNFDGLGTHMGNTLAHAFFPHAPLKGQIHFDEDEKWTKGIRHGTDLLQVAVHEIGHTLGLNHSEVGDSIMHMLYKKNLAKVELHSDDIAGIQQIYGMRMMMGSGD